MSHYPHSPGWKESDTSKKSAEKIKPLAKSVSELVLTEYRFHTRFHSGGLTADEVAAKLQGYSILTVRPRVTELYKQGKLVDTGLRRKNASGHMAKVWKLATPES